MSREAIATAAGKRPMALKMISAANIATLLRVGLACIFFWSALPKIQSPQLFLAKVYEFEILGPDAGLMVAMLIPFAELSLSVCVFANLFSTSAALLSTLLLALFTAVQVSVIWRGLDIGWGCFSMETTREGAITYVTLLRTGLLAFLAGSLLWICAREELRAITPP